MKISFDKIGSSPKYFEFILERLTMRGTLERKGAHIVELIASLEGGITLDCDRCGERYFQPLDDEIKLVLTDKLAETKDDLDIIEFLDGIIDIGWIVESEANSLAGDYHFCGKCVQSNDILEIEI